MFFSVVPAVAIACSDVHPASVGAQDESDAAPGGALPAEGGSSVADLADGAGLDAAFDAEVVKPPRTCTDEGWCHTVVPDAQTLRDVWGDGEGVVWAVSEGGNVLRWDGTAWAQSYAAGTALYAVWGSHPTDLWVGGESGVFHGTGTSSSSLTWTFVPTAVPVRSIWGTSSSDVWAVGYAGTTSAGTGAVLHCSSATADVDAGDAEVSCEADPGAAAFPARFTKVWGTAADDVWLVGTAGAVAGPFKPGRPPPQSTLTTQVLRRGSDGAGGLSWRKSDAPAVSGAVALTSGTSASRTLVSLCLAGRACYTGRSSDEGASFSWAPESFNVLSGGFTTLAISAIWAGGSNDIWSAAEIGRLVHGDGLAWRTAAISLDEDIPLDKPFYAIWGSGPNDVWAVGAGIALHKRAPKNP
ncbi:MAG: hypothetical protein KF850_03885 [Labilithrix sp.]|nr:hypothetical protein [Labilithrix sp.]